MPKCSIPMAPCNSSQLDEFGYDPATQTLAMRFKAKTRQYVYQYANVPAEHYEALRAADADPEQSVGKTFGALIRGHADRYPFTKLDELDEEPGAA